MTESPASLEVVDVGTIYPSALGRSWHPPPPPVGAVGEGPWEWLAPYVKVEAKHGRALAPKAARLGGPNRLGLAREGPGHGLGVVGGGEGPCGEAALI